jgi:hypothetical protein
MGEPRHSVVSLVRWCFGPGLPAHLLRGALGLTLLWWAIGNWQASPAPAVVGAVIAVVLMRGCPMCWLFGLGEVMFRGRAKT